MVGSDSDRMRGGDNNNGTRWVRGWRRASERGGVLRPLKGHEELRGRTRGEDIISWGIGRGGARAGYVRKITD